MQMQKGKRGELVPNKPVVPATSCISSRIHPTVGSRDREEGDRGPWASGGVRAGHRTAAWVLRLELGARACCYLAAECEDGVAPTPAQARTRPDGGSSPPRRARSPAAASSALSLARDLRQRIDGDRRLEREAATSPPLISSARRRFASIRRRFVFDSRRFVVEEAGEGALRAPAPGARLHPAQPRWPGSSCSAAMGDAPVSASCSAVPTTRGRRAPPPARASSASDPLEGDERRRRPTPPLHPVKGGGPRRGWSSSASATRPPRVLLARGGRLVELVVWEPGRRGDGWWRRDAAKREPLGMSDRGRVSAFCSSGCSICWKVNSSVSFFILWM
jgi:hypothetical protein